MSVIKALAGGLAGACVLTALHETIRRLDPDAPRMDILGMRAISKIMKNAGETPPPPKELHTWTLAADVVSNAVYYSFTGTGNKAWWRGALLGASAGAGAILLPGPLGLGEAPSNRTPKTQLLAFSLYFIGGITAAAVGYVISSGKED